MEKINYEKLSEVSNIIMGQSPESKYYNNDGNGKLLIQGNADVKNRVTKGRNFSSIGNKEAEIGDIIMSVRAPVGTVAKSDGNYYIGRGVCAIRSNISEYIYQFLLWHETKWSIHSTGSTFDSITSNIVADLKIPIYNDVDIIKISDFLSSIDQLMYYNYLNMKGAR